MVIPGEEDCTNNEISSIVPCEEERSFTCVCDGDRKHAATDYLRCSKGICSHLDASDLESLLDVLLGGEYVQGMPEQVRKRM